jgi:hypothetical protein
MRRILTWVAAWLLAIGLLSPLGAEEPKSSELIVPLKVFTGGSNTPVYVGEYVVTQSGPQVTEKQRYRKPSGETIIERDSVFDLDKRRPVSFLDRNFITGKVFKATVDGSKIKVRIEDLKGNVETDKTVSLPKDAYIWPNFSYVLAQDWDKLTKGNDYEARIFVLSRQDDYGMQVKSEGDATVGGVAGKRFRLEPSSAFVRAVAPATHLTFAVDAPHRVIRYEGNGAVQGADGKNLDATIVFEWPKA